MEDLYEEEETQAIVSADGSWIGIQLGDSFSSVETSLEKAGRKFEIADANTIDLEDMTTYLSFESGAPSRLAMMVHEADSVQFKGTELMGILLDEALERLGVRSFDDTLWSILDVDFEWTNGARVADSKRPTTATPNELLTSGTLWIKSLGIGLIMHLGSVSRIAFCAPKDVPTIGCGPLEPSIFELLLRDNLREELIDEIKTTQAANQSKIQGGTRLVLLVLAIGCLASPLVHSLIAKSTWMNSTKINGTVVEVGDALAKVEYTPGETTSSILTDIPLNHVPSQAIGANVPMLIQKNGSGYVSMTESQAKDTFYHMNPAYAFWGIIAGVFLLFRAAKG